MFENTAPAPMLLLLCFVFEVLISYYARNGEDTRMMVSYDTNRF